MHARIEDPRGPRRTRLLLPALGALLVVIDRLLAASSVSPLFFLGLCFAIAGGAWFRSFGARRCVLDPGERGVHVRGAGTLSQHIDVRSVASASTARTPDGVLLSVGRRDGSVISLHVEDEARAEVLRHALGIGRHGLRTLRFAARRREDHALQRATQVLAIATFAAFAMLGWLLPSAATPTLALVLTMMLGAAAFAALTPPRAPFDGEWHLDDKGFAAGSGRSVESLRWDEIAHAFARPWALVVVRTSGAVSRFPFDPPGHGDAGMTTAEARNVAYQICDAARRARGEVARSPDVVGVAALERREPDPRAYLERLDSLVFADGAADTYRSHGIDRSVLTGLLESPDVTTAIRAAAARVLLRIDPRERGRVESALYRVREDRLTSRLRVFVSADAEMAEEAADELAPLTGRLRHA